MDMKDEKDISKREHLMQVLESAEEGSEIYESALAQLDDCPDVPFYIAHVWEWFWLINKGRTSGAYGPNSLTWEGIEAWQNLMQIQIRPIEVEILYEIDSVYLKCISDRNKKKQKPKKGKK